MGEENQNRFASITISHAFSAQQRTGRDMKTQFYVYTLIADNIKQIDKVRSF